MTTRFPFCALGFAALLLSACDDASAPMDPEPEQFEEADEEARPILSREEFERAEREADLPEPKRVDNGDGTWSYAMDEGFDPDIELRGNVLTWAYDGQAKFSDEPEMGGERTFVVPEPVEQTPEDRLLEHRRLDDRGRWWKIVDVDHEAWMSSTATAPEELEDDHPEATTLRHVEEDLEPGTEVTWQPTSWQHSSCVAGGGLNPNEAHFWNSDGRYAPSNLTARQKTAVQIRSFGSPACSGVILRSREVLTAAHCVSDNNNNPVPLSQISVRRVDNGEVRTAADIDFPNSYTGGSGSGGGTDFADDWAIIELSSSWSSGYEDMDLSSAGDGTLDNLDRVQNLAFPQFFPLCQNAGGHQLIHNTEFEPIASIANKKLRFKIDGTPGHSGSPLYYCPEGDNDICGGGEKGFVIGVWAGWNTSNNRFVGPKSAFFFDDAMAFMDD
ncbi:MAG: trypsin-like serine protease [Nannocystaceae bacterium]|nr:S1 family peptidase [bacterium]